MGKEPRFTKTNVGGLNDLKSENEPTATKSNSAENGNKYPESNSIVAKWSNVKASETSNQQTTFKRPSLDPVVSGFNVQQQHVMYSVAQQQSLPFVQQQPLTIVQEQPLSYLPQQPISYSFIETSQLEQPSTFLQQQPVSFLQEQPLSYVQQQPLTVSLLETSHIPPDQIFAEVEECPQGKKD